MIVKASERKSHTTDLEGILELVRNYNMHLNIAKCSFDIQARKFLGFMLTRIGIKAIVDKCQTIIDMRSPFQH